jgi:23S rRNA (uracil1939-C5)-methyltransferase
MRAMTQKDEWLKIESLDMEAQGVARNSEGKVVFVEGALPGEEVQVVVSRQKNQWEQASYTSLRRESSQRVRPGCPHFGLHPGACGGCKMQHLESSGQVAIKQRVLEDNLDHLGKVKPDRIMRPIEGPAWGYRYRARLSVRYVPRKETVLVGFHERKSRYVADMSVCPVLPPKVSSMLIPLRELIGGMQARDTLPQIELAIGDGITALVLRHLQPLVEGDLGKLRDFAARHQVQWWLQPKGPDSVHLLEPGDHELAYSLPEFGLTMPFRPTDFTQVNHQINTVLVGRALRLLDVRSDERVIDWFCGLGNFTLPIATRCRKVLGIEGSEALVERSRHNAVRNGLADRATFQARNLFEMTPQELKSYGRAEKWLIDPPREGAFALSKALADCVSEGAVDGWCGPRRIVYVSCNPATLARDAGLLVHVAGYRCVSAGAVNMFPHTAHVESMAVFEKVGEMLT